MKFALAIAVALAGFNLHALPLTVIATFNTELYSETIQRDVGPGYGDGVNGAGYIDTTTGMFQFTRTGGTEPGSPAGIFYAFCIEPREFVSQGTTYTYDFSDLSQGTTNIGGMGVAKANLLRELFGRNYPVLGATITAEKASAMQIAIWEIVRENSGSLNVTSGNVQFRNPQDPNALTLAQTYLSALNGTGPHLNNLYALTFDGAQDVIVQIPEPAMAFATGLALIALALIARARAHQLPSR